MTGIEMSMSRFKNTAGFTLIELLVSMAIGLGVIAAVAGTFTAQTRQNNAEEQIAQMQQNVRGALDLMVREIHMAKYNPAGATAFSSAYGVTYNASQLEVKADIDGDGYINPSSGSVEHIIYAHDPTNRYITRKLGSSGTAEIVADNITAFTFNYYDANGSAVTSSANSGNIRKVTVNITARTAKPDPSYGYRTYQLSADITPPNLPL
jgi:type IV pilus assembly protein PilW